MKKLLLTLTLLTSISSLHSMEMPNKQVCPYVDYSKPSPITLRQIYYHLARVLNPDIALHIFSLQPGTYAINEKISLKRRRKEGAMRSVVERLESDIYIKNLCYGHCLTVEILKRNFLRKNMSICDFTDDYSNETILHNVAKDRLSKDAKIFLEVAGNDVSKLLIIQDKNGQTALHVAAKSGNVKLVKLLLDAAGNHIQNFANIRDKDGKTALDISSAEVMLQYIQLIRSSPLL